MQKNRAEFVDGNNEIGAEAAKRQAHGVRNNRSPMQAPARVRSVGERHTPMTSRPEGATNTTCIVFHQQNLHIISYLDLLT